MRGRGNFDEIIFSEIDVLSQILCHFEMVGRLIPRYILDVISGPYSSSHRLFTHHILFLSKYSL